MLSKRLLQIVKNPNTTHEKRVELLTSYFKQLHKKREVNNCPDCNFYNGAEECETCKGTGEVTTTVELTQDELTILVEEKLIDLGFDYRAKRLLEYAPIGDQLDAITKSVIALPDDLKPFFKPLVEIAEHNMAVKSKYKKVGE